MRRFWLALVVVAMMAMALTFSVSGQEGGTAAEGEAEPGILTVQQSLTVSATVNVEINGQVVQLVVPATILVDAQATLADALLAVPSEKRVGVLGWDIVAIEEYDQSFVYDRFYEYEPSSGNKLAVVRSVMTNLESTPIEFYREVEVMGVDTQGNTYEVTERQCDDVNPLSTGQCTLVFDVPTTVTIAGLDLAVTDRKRLLFEPTE